MTVEIKIIDLGGVNCYLVCTDHDYILIDTGFISKRAKLEQELIAAGYRPGNLNLILLTHGDTDHADNASCAKSLAHKSRCMLLKHLW